MTLRTHARISNSEGPRSRTSVAGHSRDSFGCLVIRAQCTYDYAAKKTGIVHTGDDSTHGWCNRNKSFPRPLIDAMGRSGCLDGSPGTLGTARSLDLSYIYARAIALGRADQSSKALVGTQRAGSRLRLLSRITLRKKRDRPAERIAQNFRPLLYLRKGGPRRAVRATSHREPRECLRAACEANKRSAIARGARSKVGSRLTLPAGGCDAKRVITISAFGSMQNRLTVNARLLNASAHIMQDQTICYRELTDIEPCSDPTASACATLVSNVPAKPLIRRGVGVLQMRNTDHDE